MQLCRILKFYTRNFFQKSFNECEEPLGLSKLADQTQRKMIYYSSLNLFVICRLQADAARCCISEVHKIPDVLLFLEIRGMSRILSNVANPYRIYN